MDPDETLEMLRKSIEATRSARGISAVLQAATEAVYLAETLDEWMSNGGFAPGEWGGR